MKKKILPIIVGSLLAASLVSTLAWNSLAQNDTSLGTGVSTLDGTTSKTHSATIDLETSLSASTEEVGMYLPGDEITVTGRLSQLEATAVANGAGLSAYTLPLKFDTEVFEMVSLKRGASIPEGDSFSDTFSARPEQVNSTGQTNIIWMATFPVGATVNDVQWLYSGAELFTMVLKVKDDAPVGKAELTLFNHPTYSISTSVGFAEAACVTSTNAADVNIVTELGVVKTYVDQNGEAIKDTEVDIIEFNSSYAATIPEIEGYEFVKATVDGQPADVNSNKVEINPVVKRYSLRIEYKASTPLPASYTITEKYVDENGTEIAGSTSTTVNSGNAYEKAAPVIKGYLIEKVLVEGVDAGSTTVKIDSVYNNITITFCYNTDSGSSIPDPSYTITEKYVDENGEEIADPTSTTVNSGNAYKKSAPEFEGYLIEKVLIEGVEVDSTTVEVDSVFSDMTVTFSYKTVDDSSSLIDLSSDGVSSNNLNNGSNGSSSSSSVSNNPKTGDSVSMLVLGVVLLAVLGITILLSKKQSKK